MFSSMFWHQKRVFHWIWYKININFFPVDLWKVIKFKFSLLTFIKFWNKETRIFLYISLLWMYLVDRSLALKRLNIWWCAERWTVNPTKKFLWTRTKRESLPMQNPSHRFEEKEITRFFSSFLSIILAFLPSAFVLRKSTWKVHMY